MNSQEIEIYLDFYTALHIFFNPHFRWKTCQCRLFMFYITKALYIKEYNMMQVFKSLIVK